MIDYFETKSQPITRLMVWQAYQKVRANKGGAGIDNMTWELLDKNLRTELYKLWNRLTSGTYFPPAVKEISIPKKDGGERKLGIPTILDRIAQEVVRSYLEPFAEPHFHNSSYGYRPNRNPHQAIEAVLRNEFNHDWVIDLDIQSYFDTIDHELLIKSVMQFCREKWIIMYIRRWLEAGIMKSEGEKVERTSGTPQGGVISPLLSNIFLHFVFDKWMEKYHHEKPFVRYADDIVVHCKSDKQSYFMLKEITKRMEECKLKVHPAKTKIINHRGLIKTAHSRKFDFLGYTFKPCWVKTKVGMKLMIKAIMSNNSRQKVLEKIRKLKIHKIRKPIEKIAEILNPILRGIINYYCKFNPGKTYLVWYQINQRIIKWLKWERGFSKSKAIKWLKQKWEENPKLFVHWDLAHPI
jgi:RNA-directed DNA polymerase